MKRDTSPSLSKRFFGYGLAILLGLALPLTLIGSLFYDGTSTLRNPWIVLAAYAPAMSVACLNFHLSFVRPRLWMREHGNMEGYLFVSGAPAVGTVAAAIAAAVTFGSDVGAAMGLVICLLDTGGMTWFMIMCLRHRLLD